MRNITLPTRRQWNHDKPAIKDGRLEIAGRQVMDGWEADYMAALADQVPVGARVVLEVGYGLGLLAKAIQRRMPKMHVVIECHPDIAAAAGREHVDNLIDGRMAIMCGFWEDVVEALAPGGFDAIVFDSYPLMGDAQAGRNHFPFFPHAQRLLAPSGTFTYFSDEVVALSDDHLYELHRAGFRPEDITTTTVTVTPPQDCEYWKATTIVVPRVRKSSPA